MTSERYKTINSLVDSLLDIPAKERASFLDRCCAGDPLLRRDVEALLEAHESQDDLLETPLLELIARDVVADAPENELSGCLLGGYEILSRLGAGGIGEVWLARDSELKRQVALKLLSSKLAGDPRQVQRFKLEARAASRLNHPNIVTIHEIGEAEGLDFIAQEFIDGVTVRQEMGKGPMPLEALLDVATQVSAALAAAHRAGIIHRDIKPENVMIRKDGLVKVLDFGLARFVDDMSKPSDLPVANTNLTIPGLVLGTVRYMSPEQARGLPLDPRSDIFSFGVVLYEMATGNAPFGGPTPADTLASILTHDPPALATYAPHLPAEFERIVLRCLQKNREDRYADAESLGADLNALAGHIAASEKFLPVCQPALTKATAGPIRHTRALLLAFAAILAIAVAVFMLRGRRDQERTELPFASMRISRVMLRGPVSDAVIGPDGTHLAYVRKDDAGESIWLTDLVASGEQRQIASETGDHSGLMFSPDGRYLYYRRTLTTEDGTLYRVALAGKPGASKVLDGIRGDVALSPDGQELAFVRLDPSRLETALMVAKADGGNRRKVAVCTRPDYFSRFGLAWSFDKRWIVCFAGKGRSISSQAYRAERVRVADGWRQPVSAKTWEWVQSVVWPAKTDSLLVNAGESVREDSYQIWKLSLKNGNYSRVTNDLNSYTRLSSTSDGKLLSAMQSERSASLWVQSAQKGAGARQISDGDIDGLESVAWLPDDRIVYTALTGDYRNLWVTDARGSNATQLTFGPNDKSEVSATRDGRYLLYQSGAKIWRVDANGYDARQLTGGAHDVHPTGSADGRYVIYVSFVGWSPSIGSTPSIWRVPIEGGKAVQLIDQPLSYPRVSPDGKWIMCSYYPKGDPRFSTRQIAVISANGGALEVLDRPARVDADVSWTNDGRGITFSRALRGAGNIWQQGLDGGAPVQLTKFEKDEIFTYRRSMDGKWLAMVRGKQLSNVVLIRDF